MAEGGEAAGGVGVIKLIATEYEPHWVVEFSEADVELLDSCAKSHYDAACRAMAEVGGLIFGMRNEIKAERAQAEHISNLAAYVLPIQRRLTFRELDLLCKIVEREPLTLKNELRAIMDQALKDYQEWKYDER